MQWRINMLLGAEELVRGTKPSQTAPNSLGCNIERTADASWQQAHNKAQPAQQEDSCSNQPPWVPNPPLRVAPPGTDFVPFPASLGIEGFWELDKTLSTPFPTPVHKLLNIGAFGVHLQSMCPGVLVEETPDVVRLCYAPVPLDGDQSLAKLPVHLLTYSELLHKDHKAHCHVGFARDITIGRVEVEGFLGADGTMYGRLTKRGLMTGRRIDWVCEDTVKVDAAGLTIILDQQVFDRKGSTASQRMVLHRRPKAAANVMLKQQLPSDSGSEPSEGRSELNEGASCDSDE